MSADVIQFHCSACQALLTVPSSMAGVSGPCPTCGQTVTSPSPRPVSAFTSQPQAAAPAPAPSHPAFPPISAPTRRALRAKHAFVRRDGIAIVPAVAFRACALDAARISGTRSRSAAARSGCFRDEVWRFRGTPTSAAARATATCGPRESSAISWTRSRSRAASRIARSTAATSVSSCGLGLVAAFGGCA